MGMHYIHVGSAVNTMVDPGFVMFDKMLYYIKQLSRQLFFFSFQDIQGSIIRSLFWQSQKITLVDESTFH